MTAAAARAADYTLGHGDPTIHVEHYDLAVAYRVRTNRLDGTAVLRIRTLVALDELALDLTGLQVARVTLTGAALAKHRHRGGRLAVRLRDAVPAGTLLQLTVAYGGSPRPSASRWGEVGWEELADGVIVASQPTGAPSWFPCNDRPQDKATYRTEITVEQPYAVVAHGTLTARRARAGTTTWVHEERHPTSTYLATVHVGRFQEVPLAAAPVPQRALVPPAHVPAAARALARHGEMTDLFARLFGPYPFDGYTLVVTPDALEIPVEAQGMSVFGANHLAGGDGERLVPHELAHQWFGNAVSVASWQHIWLNEGFACYAEWLWSEGSGGPTAAALAAQHHARLARLPQDLVLADPGPDRMFDDRVYKRGALALHALRSTLGDDVFFGLVRAWTARHRHGSVTTEDFRRCAREHAGEERAGAVDELLDRWLHRPALPALP